MNLLDVIIKGSMSAVAMIIDSKGIDRSKISANNLDAELKLQIANGYEQAAADAKEAMNTLGEPMARATLNASCILFATRALQAAGYLTPASATSQS
jgi:hypothetical protein